MWIKIIFSLNLIFSLVSNQQIQIHNTCSCAQLLTQADCKRNKECQWELIKQLCFSKLEQQIPQIQSQSYYCYQFSDAQSCAKTHSCLWNDNQCTFFTGCTPYTYDTDKRCQAVSARCLSDGVHCIEFNVCQAYMTQKSCFVNLSGQYCYWNIGDTLNPKCEDADDCQKLPLTLDKDFLCRAQISKCTVSIKGGCIESGMECKDQILEVNCVTNRDRSQQCFWNQGKCYEKTCNNAMTSLKTDSDCKQFLASCTTKLEGGCITRTTCTSAIQAACYTDSSGADCFWNDNQCSLKTCNNAFKTLKTNSSCQQYLPKCITNGSGCVDNVECEPAKVIETCDKTLTGQLCNWNGTACKPKTCVNAGPNYMGHDQCTAYMNTCTNDRDKGCIDRSCDNAPLLNNTNDLCQQYLNANCITKKGGGCRVNTLCNQIDIDIACVKDINGSNCFWDNGICKSKTCENAPTNNNTHELCQEYSPYCTVDQNNKCVDKICQNIIKENNCNTDFNSKKCIYIGKCYTKQCKFASDDYRTHEQCQQYLTSCTLDNSGQGCMIIPENCQDITNINSCKIKYDGSNCKWRTNQCVDDICETAPTDGTFKSSQLCYEYKAECVVNNNLNGCMELSKQCQSRKQSENCTVEQTRLISPKCEWDNLTYTSNPICINIECQNAHLVSLKDNVTIDGCWNYFSLKCVVAKNKDTTVCMPRPNSCFGLMKETCQKQLVLVGDISCFWDKGSNSCKVIACSSITFSNGTIINHDACNEAMSQCTVDAANGTQCISVMNLCSWQNEACSIKRCENAIDSDQFDTNEECQTFLPKCQLSSKQCSLKQTACVNYQNQTQCEMHVLNQKQQCSWNNGACSNRQQFDCTLVTGQGLTIEYCQNQNTTCSVNAAGTACIASQWYCSSYSEADCKYEINANREQLCMFNTDTKQCNVDCSALPGPYFEFYCENLSSYACTIKSDRTGCRSTPKLCSDNDEENCIHAANPYLSNCYLLDGKCTDSYITPISTSQQCNSINKNYGDYTYCLQVSQQKCVTNALKTSCIPNQKLCSDYLSQNGCFFSFENGYCFWSASRKCIQKSVVECRDYSGTSQQECQQKISTCGWSTGQTCELKCDNIQVPITIQGCKLLSFKCTANINGLGCLNIQQEYCANATQENCTSATYSLCYWLDNSCISSNLTPIASQDCIKISGSFLNNWYCANISRNLCCVNTLQTNCVAKKNYCSDYNSDLQNCFSSLQEYYCVLDSTGKLCVNYYQQQKPSCEDVKLFGKKNDYLDSDCNQINGLCQAKSDGTGCELKLNCGQYKGVNLNYYYCVYRLKGCSVNSAKTQCIVAKNTCGEYSTINCGYSIDEGECIIQNNVCVQNNCDNAPSNINDMNGCQAYSTNCIKKIGGCENICQTNLLQSTCSNKNNCLWNPIAGNCVDKYCVSAEASTSFDTHIKCQTAGNCTVKAKDDKTIGQGCIPLAACNTYLHSEQCKISDSGNKCYWAGQDPINQFCTDKKSCLTAPITCNSHLACLDYMNGCTVYINEEQAARGCTPYKKCKDYVQAQCFISSEKDKNNNNINCGWNGYICTYKSCATAEPTDNDHSKCSQYLEGCTVNDTDDGCIVIPDQCEGMTKNQCFDGSVDFSNRKCFWLDNINQCITKKCENSPNYQNENECETYLSSCTTDTQKCKTFSCEYLTYSTDDECKLAEPICTTNGVNCVKRETCEQVEAEAGCIVDNNGQLCQWIFAETSYCTKRTCENAPLTLITESDCQQYFTPPKGTCTTKKNGGCITKSTCIAASIQSACVYDSFGVECIWDNEIFVRLEPFICKKQNSQCTVGLNGKCAIVLDCEKTIVQEACVEGKNGLCLWISKFSNSDGSNGACFLYDSCQSLDWKIDTECKQISPNCTTDGQKCVAITNCAESNTNGGCKTGTDGQCVQTLSIKGANDQVCKKYSTCDQVYYLTHQECFKANSNCTSDYSKGCVSLSSCSSYSKDGQCVVNKEGVTKDAEGAVTSTGQCVWDSEANLCRDKQCKDIIKITDSDCASELQTCSTDGSTCILKQTCHSYTNQNTCNIASGTDGVCYWVNATETQKANCKIKTCADIQNGKTIDICSELFNCVSDGINCISRRFCSEYITQIGCLSSGLDGICFWTQANTSNTSGICALADGCAQVKDYTNCNKASNRCVWNSTSNLCSEHTCESYQVQFKACTYYYTWDMKNYHICAIKDGKCVSSDVSSLNEQECYLQSSYEYSWNPKNQECVICRASIQNSTNIPNQNSTNFVFRMNALMTFLTWLCF